MVVTFLPLGSILFLKPMLIPDFYMQLAQENLTPLFFDYYLCDANDNAPEAIGRSAVLSLWCEFGGKAGVGGELLAKKICDI